MKERGSGLRVTLAAALVAIFGAASAPRAIADEADPDLPAGLDAPADEDAGPGLPDGLEDEPDSPGGLDDEPDLPNGIDDPESQPGGEGEAPLVGWLELTGFWEVRAGVRTQHDPHERQASIGETRLQLEWERSAFDDAVTGKVVADVLYDAVLDRHRVDLDRGRGLFDLREANAAFSPADWMDVKIGRQIATWGTGDLVFLNDLFPKDWRSFLAGRDVEYLKAPSDAVRASVFNAAANIALIYTPRFDADRYIRGERLSFYNPATGRRTGRDAVIDAEEPRDCFGDHEIALRVYRTISGYEVAGYGYHGFWKSPAGQNHANGKVTFPDLSVYGGSLRGPVGRGIGNVEMAYYDSRDDADGDDPMVRNSEWRMLAGYTQDVPEIAKDLTVGVQYYLEWMTDHADYRQSLPAGASPADRCRHVVTTRITKLMMNQNLTASLFVFYSPSDSDAYFRPNVQYRLDDHWTVEFGANVFVGADNHTFFGQFANNTNVYGALRYGF